MQNYNQVKAMGQLYTISIKTRRGKTIHMYNCIKGDDGYYRPVKYRNGSPEHEDLAKIDIFNELGWDYEKIDLPSDCSYISFKKQTEPKEEQ